MISTPQSAAAFQLGQGGAGLLLLHGFGGTAGQMRFLANGLHEAGYTVYAPLLPGHGTTLEEMNQFSWRDWLTAARLAYSRLREECSSVAVAGHSMGGVLALLLAEEYPVDAVITLSAPLKLLRHGAALTPLMGVFLPFVRWEPMRLSEEFLSEDYIGYDGLPTARIADLNRLMCRARRNLFAICAPLLTIQSDDDEIVHPDSPRLIAGGVSSAVRQSIRLTHSMHLIHLGPERGEILRQMLTFLNKYLIHE